MSVSIAEFLKLRATIPVLDVRSPSEFNDGHIRNAINIPVLNDEERIIVGTTYKQKGQQEAIRDGFRLVGPRLPGLIEQAKKASQGNEVLVHCWRGGMRSGNFCKFLEAAAITSQSLQGGYKAYRQRALESFRIKLPIMLITGFTGSGKSEILRSLKERGEQILDLESLACHKGSAFGGLLMPGQPSTEQFQNELFEEISMLDPARRIWVEDESLAIGKIFLPVDFWNTMKMSPLVEVNLDKSIRIDRLVGEYGESDPLAFLDIMGKIIKRLGGQHYNAAKERLLSGDMAATIDILLTYYDKAYRESIDKRKDLLVGQMSWDGKDQNKLTDELINLDAQSF